MKDLKNNIDSYMKLKNIKTYSCLLRNIANELGIKGQAAYKFAASEKSNFSKMLKGERPLKYEYIIPLEKIFGVSLARLLEEDSFKLPVEKENVPFDKGFRYYAYLDDSELYKKEFDILSDKNGNSIITQTDEFGKTFIDYIVEYGSVNGVRYLYDEYGIKYNGYRNYFDFNNTKDVTIIGFQNIIEFARLVAKMNDVKLFNDIYDSYCMFFFNGHYGNSVFCNDEYLEILLDNDCLFKSIFEAKSYEIKLTDLQRKEKGVDYITCQSINPIINNCLRYSLQNLNKYKHRAIEMLNFGINYNKKIAAEIDVNDCYIFDELGGLKPIKGKDCLKLVIFVDADIEITDSDTKALVEQLPKRTRKSGYQLFLKES